MFGNQNSLEADFSEPEYSFLAKFAKFSNHDISKRTHSINTKFEGEFYVYKWTSWVVQHYKICLLYTSDAADE